MNRLALTLAATVAGCAVSVLASANSNSGFDGFAYSGTRSGNVMSLDSPADSALDGEAAIGAVLGVDRSNGNSNSGECFARDFGREGVADFVDRQGGRGGRPLASPPSIVPEPASVAALVTGMIGLEARRRKRRG